MGGVGSGRIPNVENLIAQKELPIATEMFIPNYSGLNIGAKKEDADHNDGNAVKVALMIFGTSAAPPTASTVPIDTIYLRYTA